MGIAGGVESMSLNDMSTSVPEVRAINPAAATSFSCSILTQWTAMGDAAVIFVQVNFERVADNKLSKDCTIPMGMTSDEIATRFNVSRRVSMYVCHPFRSYHHIIIAHLLSRQCCVTAPGPRYLCCSIA